MYSKKVLKYFKKPLNYGRIKDADGVGKVGNLVCGDLMHLFIKVSQNREEDDIIKDISFQTFGCVAAISTSSMITELAKGKTLKQALLIGKNDIINSLGGLPSVKIHCSVLAVDALSEAIYNYLIENKKEIPEILVKKHKRIEKEEQLMKEKYRDWIEIGEKMFEEK